MQQAFSPSGRPIVGRLVLVEASESFKALTRKDAKDFRDYEVTETETDFETAQAPEDGRQWQDKDGELWETPQLVWKDVT